MQLLNPLSLLLSLLLFTTSAAQAAKLTVATEGAYPPFNFYDEAGNLTGFDVEIALALCAEMEVECELVTRDWDKLIPALVNRDVDLVVASMASTPERDEQVDFTQHYYRSHVTFVGRSGLVEHNDPESLSGMRLATGKSTIQADYLIAHYPDNELILTDDMEQALELLRSGKVDLVLSDTTFTLTFLQSPEGQGFDYIGEPLRNDILKSEACIAVTEGNDDLRRQLNEAIERIRLNGQYDRIRIKYFLFDIY